MPTSSQSKILSVVDNQLYQQQQTSGNEPPKRPPGRLSINQPINESRQRQQKDDRHSSIENKIDVDNHSPPPSNSNTRRRSSDKLNDEKLKKGRRAQRHCRCFQHDRVYPFVHRDLPSARTSHRGDVLHVPVININHMVPSGQRAKSSVVNANDSRQNRPSNSFGRPKSTLTDTSTNIQYGENSFIYDNDNDNQYGNEYKSRKRISGEENASSQSDGDNANYNNDDDDYDYDYDYDENVKNGERRSSLLNENARRLLILGTIRPSRTFYKNLSEADAEHLMEYFRRMKNTHQRVTSEEINQELSKKYVEYKPKIFFDSACVTKTQVTNIENLMEQYADKIRSQKAEIVKLDNPMRFVIKQVDSDTTLTTIPREYNDCFITLITRSDPLRKSDLVTELARDKFSEDVKTNSLDISYFPGGVNYDVPHDEIDENGQMQIETYQKLKKRLNNRQVWYFSGPPEKKPNAVLAIFPPNPSFNIDHRRLLDALYDRLKSSSTNENSNKENRILSIEFVPLSCVFNSNDVSNQFIVDCDSDETKKQLMDKPLKITSNKQSVTLELRSYDENIQKEYDKFIKSEKYRELVKNHEAAVKRNSNK